MDRKEWNKTKRKAYYEIWKNSDRCVNCGATEREANTLKCSACNDIARRASLIYARKLRTEAFAAYGGAKCACCGETEIMFLSIDHIDGNGSEHRRQIAEGHNSNNFYLWLRKHGYPAGFQVLCQNCNVGKWRNSGICPHQQR